MGLKSDLATAQGLATSLQSHNAPALIQNDAGAVVTDLSGYLSALQADAATAQALQTQLQNDNAPANVTTDINKLVLDLASFLS